MSGEAPFHAHVYYDPAQRDAAARLRDRLCAMSQVRFAGPLRDGPIGPHPLAQFETHFAQRDVGAVSEAIAAAGLRALIHPLTDDDLADHTALARWIGEPVALDLTALDPPGTNQGVARFGQRDV